MSILRDWKEDNTGVVFGRKVLYFFSPKVWYGLHKSRTQRADRGWSDRDTWGAGEYIAQVTADMLQHLNDNTYVDWPEWFKLNVQEKGKSAYTDLQQVIDDINVYLEFSKTTWADGLDIEVYNSDKLFEKRKNGARKLSDSIWVDATTRKRLTERQIDARINMHHRVGKKLYADATKAMKFFGAHFASFCD